MNDTSAEVLASLIKSVGTEKADQIVLTAYRLGFIDGQNSMSRIAQSQLEFLLQGMDKRAREAGL